MADLNLMGGHKPGTSDKANPETAVNVFNEGTIVRNRYGYNDFDPATPVPQDVTQGSFDLNRSGSTVTVDFSAASVAHGYEVGDAITIAGATVTDYNGDWTINGIVTSGGSGANRGHPYGFTFDIGGATPANDTSQTGTVILTNGDYDKEIRGIFKRVASVGGVLNEFAYVVVGNRVYDFDGKGAGGWQSIGNEVTDSNARLNSMTGKVVIAQVSEDPTESVVICDGVNAELEGFTAVAVALDSATSSVRLATPSNTCTAMDGYMIRDNKNESGQFIYSDLYDSTVENSFNFATAEGAPDDVIAVFSHNRNLWLFGEFTTEVWYNVGQKNLPFQRHQGGFFETGIAAPNTPQLLGNSIAWLARDKRGGLRVVMAGKGFLPERISTPEIEQALYEANAFVFNAFANSFIIEGQEFYALTIPGTYGRAAVANTTNEEAPTPVTFVYQLNSGEWFKWESHDDILADDDHGRWMPTAITGTYDHNRRQFGSSGSTGRTSFSNVILLGGRDLTGRLYYMKPDSFMDENPSGDQGIACERTMQPLEVDDRRNFSAGPMELLTDADAGELITVSLSYSKDGAAFTTPADRTVTATTDRLMWKKLGRARRWAFRLAQTTTATLPVRWLRLVSKGLGG